MFYKNNKIIAITFIDNPNFGPIAHVTNWPTDDIPIPSNGKICKNGITDWTLSLNITLIV